VYFGTSSPPAFIGNLAASSYDPGTLEPGTTYYWKVDEVEADGTTNTATGGEVWRFTTIGGSTKASNPYPADGATDVPTDVLLSWDPGYGATSHDVYFGTSSPPAFIGRTTNGYSPGTLEPGTTYYWKIDETVPTVDGPPIIHEGDVWSFTTACGQWEKLNGPYGCYIADLAIDPTNPQIIYAMINGGGVCGGVYKSYDGGETWWEISAGIDDLFDAWSIAIDPTNPQILYVGTWTHGIFKSTDAGNTWRDITGANITTHEFVELAFDTLDTIFYHDLCQLTLDEYDQLEDYSQIYIMACHDLRIALTKQVLPNLDPNDIAEFEYLINNCYILDEIEAFSYILDEIVAFNKLLANPNVSLETKTEAKKQMENSLTDILEELIDKLPGPFSKLRGTLKGLLEIINEVLAVIRGSITIAIIVDDFESYTADIGNRIFETWIDGRGYSTPPNIYVMGNMTGSMVDISTDVIYGGAQSMKFDYDNSGAGAKAYYSQAVRTFDVPQDWTRDGVKALSLWFRGDSTNDPEPMYVVVEDSMGTSAVVHHDNPAAAQIDAWTEWSIDLQEFSGAGVDLTNVNSIAVGLGDRHNPQPGGTGTVYFDDIRLRESTEETEDCGPTPEELTPPPAPEGYVYIGYNVVVNSVLTDYTVPLDRPDSPEDLVFVHSHTIVKDGVTVCDVIVTHVFAPKPKEEEEEEEEPPPDEPWPLPPKPPPDWPWPLPDPNEPPPDIG